VFEDRNHDGLRQDSEPGIPGVVILVDNDPRNPVSCDEDGRYRAVVTPGRHLVRMLPESIPLAYALRGLAPVEVAVAPEGPARCDLQLVRQGGSITGRVLSPRPPGAAVPRGFSPEGGVPGVMVLLNGRDFTYTDGDGYFSFRPIPAGTYDVQVDTASLPFGHVVQDSPRRQVVVGDGMSGEATCEFTIARAVRRTSF
jgi:hypothetical protein